MIVIALIALVSAVAIPTLNGVFRTSRDSFARTMALTLREARDRAMLQDKLIRLRLDLDKQQYWLEEAPGSYLKPKAVDNNLSERERQDRDKADGSAFRMVGELTKSKIDAPKGLKILEVISPRAKEPLVSGIVDVYFYSNGNSDGSSIHFKTDEDLKQTIRLHPVTGQAKIMAGFPEEKR
jgi:type II secretory pathway pseudopilin PulG